MRNLNGLSARFAIALVALLSTSYSVGASAGPTSGEVLPTSSLWSRATLAKYLGNPDLNEIYRQEQVLRSATELDLELKQFNADAPILAAQMKIFRTNLDGEIRRTFAHNLLNMTVVKKGTYRLKDGSDLYDLIAETMQESGFSLEQIAEAKFFMTSGPVNAYTFAVSKDRVGVVLFDSILEKFDRSVIKDVLKHEFGHVADEHVMASVELLTQLERTMELYLVASGQNEVINHELRQSFFDGLEQTIRSQMRISFRATGSGVNQMARRMRIAAEKSYKKSKPQFDAAAQNAAIEELLKESIEHTDILIRNFNAAGVPLTRTHQLAKIRDTLARRLAIQLGQSTDIGIPSKTLAISDLKEIMDWLPNTVTIEQETSADLFSVANGGRNGLTRFFLKQSGGQGVPDNSEFPDYLKAVKTVQKQALLEKIRENLQQSADKDPQLALLLNYLDNGNLPNPVEPSTFRSQIKDGVARVNEELGQNRELLTPTEFRSGLSGDNSDHPSDNARASNAYYYANHKDILALRNDFLRLVILREGVTRNISVLENIEANLAKNTDPAVLEAKNEVARELGILKTAEIFIEEDVLTGITAFFNPKAKGLSGFANYRNPRLEDLIHYEEMKREGQNGPFKPDPLLSVILEKVKKLQAKVPENKFLGTYRTGLEIASSSAPIAPASRSRGGMKVVSSAKNSLFKPCRVKIEELAH